MSFVVEDGSGLAEANALVSVEDCNAHHADRANAAWVGEGPAKQAAIIKATDYLCAHYRWKGLRANGDQGLCWPRQDAPAASASAQPAFAADEVPAAVRHACCELALLVISGEELDAPRERGGMVRKEKVGIIEMEYSPGASPAKSYPRLDKLLWSAGLLQSSGRNRLERV